MVYSRTIDLFQQTVLQKVRELDIRGHVQISEVSLVMTKRQYSE